MRLISWTLQSGSEQYSQDRKERTGQPENNDQNMTARTRQLGQDNWDGTSIVDNLDICLGEDLWDRNCCDRAMG
jgi:hypothetical protein